MGLLKGKTEGGSGGKRGHSNMTHWATTEEIKEATRRRRRIEAEEAARDGLAEFEQEKQVAPESPVDAD